MSQIVSPSRQASLAAPSVFPNEANAQTGAPLGSQVPGRVINLDLARVRHGDKADHMVRMLAVGDPLADTVIGKEGRRILNAGLADGLEGLTERPPAITALLQQLETMPAWVDPDMLGRGEVAALSVSPLWYELCAIGSALVHTYASPAIARLLTQTGRLTSAAPRRLAETVMWARQATTPGGLLRGAPGYQATVQVRLLHARIRSSALRHGRLKSRAARLTSSMHGTGTVVGSPA
jgi:ER-bound oxygenase mpaB/B'/Rubber oxygenase, catalytic domain